MKKQLNTTGILNELSGASAFFPRAISSPDMNVAKADVATEQPGITPTQQPDTSPKPTDLIHHSQLARDSISETPTHTQTNTKASMLARYQDSVIETIRKAVKPPGREITFVRMTPEEKSQLADIVYTYKRQGIKTSENEISRIAMSYLLEDYKANGQESILAQVIAALLA